MFQGSDVSTYSTNKLQLQGYEERAKYRAIICEMNLISSGFTHPHYVSQRFGIQNTSQASNTIYVFD